MKKAKKYLIIVLTLAFLLLPRGVVFAQVDYDDYIWQTFRTHSISGAPDLQAKLKEEVEKIVSAGHLAPFRFIFSEDFDDYYWSNPGDLVFALSYAYPYLSSQLQSQLKTYLKNEIINYPPWRAEYLFIDQGSRREYSQVPPLSHTREGWLCLDHPFLQNLYGLWLYAHNTGDWQTIQANWSLIEDFYQTYKGDVNLYAGIGGAIGFARMADHLGKATLRDQAINLIKNNLGGSFATFDSRAQQRLNTQEGICYSGNCGKGVLYLPVFYDLTPEVGRYLAEHKLADVKASFNHLVYIAPTWYMTKGVLFNEIVAHEITFNPPNSNWGAFLAEAFILQKPGSELRKHIGTSYTRVGDLYYIVKLTSAIRAHGTTVWEDVRSRGKSVSQGIADYGDVVTFTISLIGTGQPMTVTDPIPSGLAYVSGSASRTPEIGMLSVDGNLLRWTGTLTAHMTLKITFAATVTVTTPTTIRNTAFVDDGQTTSEWSATLIANGYRIYLPTIIKG